MITKDDFIRWYDLVGNGYTKEEAAERFAQEFEMRDDERNALEDAILSLYSGLVQIHSPEKCKFKAEWCTQCTVMKNTAFIRTGIVERRKEK